MKLILFLFCVLTGAFFPASGAVVVTGGNGDPVVVTLTEPLSITLTSNAPTALYLVIENALRVTDSTVNEPVTAFGAAGSIGSYVHQLSSGGASVDATGYAPWGTWETTHGAGEQTVDLLIGFFYPFGQASAGDEIVFSAGSTTLDTTGGNFAGSGAPGGTWAYLTANDTVPPTRLSQRMETMIAPEPGRAGLLAWGSVAMWCRRTRKRC